MSHVDVDFSTLDAWQAWCRAQDGGRPNTAYDTRHEPLGAADMFGACMLLFMPALFWGGVTWALVWGR